MIVHHYDLVLTCPTDGAPLENAAEGVPVDGGCTIQATAQCTKCRRRYLIRVELEEMGTCGTDRGYMEHRRKGETPCVACKAAHALDEKERRAIRLQLR